MIIVPKVWRRQSALCETRCSEKRESSLLQRLFPETDQDAWRAKEEHQEGFGDSAVEDKSSKTRKVDYELWRGVRGSAVPLPSPFVVSTKGTVGEIFGSTSYHLELTEICLSWGGVNSLAFPGVVHTAVSKCYQRWLGQGSCTGVNRATLHSRVLHLIVVVTAEPGLRRCLG